MKAVRLLEYGGRLEFNDVPSDDAALSPGRQLSLTVNSIGSAKQPSANEVAHDNGAASAIHQWN